MEPKPNNPDIAICINCGETIARIENSSTWRHARTSDHRCMSSLNFAQASILSENESCHCDWEYPGQNPEGYCDFCTDCEYINGPRQNRIIVLDDPLRLVSFCHRYSVMPQWIIERNDHSIFAGGTPQGFLLVGKDIHTPISLKGRRFQGDPPSHWYITPPPG